MEEGLYYIWRRSTAQLIWAFVFAYAKSKFSHGAVHIIFESHFKSSKVSREVQIVEETQENFSLVIACITTLPDGGLQNYLIL